MTQHSHPTFKLHNLTSYKKIANFRMTKTYMMRGEI